ncbi:MAG: hypothetical protein Tsb0020_21130 [Haliangiales bacterium]
MLSRSAPPERIVWREEAWTGTSRRRLSQTRRPTDLLDLATRRKVAYINGETQDHLSEFYIRLTGSCFPVSRSHTGNSLQVFIDIPGPAAVTLHVCFYRYSVGANGGSATNCHSGVSAAVGVHTPAHLRSLAVTPTGRFATKDACSAAYQYANDRHRGQPDAAASHAA